MRIHRICIAVGLLMLFHACTLLAVQPPTDEQKRAERLFRDVYGKEYDRLAALKNVPADKVLFSRKLWDASKESRESPELARYLAERAYPFALADPAGYPTALEIRRNQVKESKDRIESLAALASVLDRIARWEKPDQRTKPAMELIDVYREAAELAHEASRDADATGYLQKAKAAISFFFPATHAATLLKDIQNDHAFFEFDRKNTAEFKRWNGILRDKPDDPKANLAIGLISLREGKIPAAAPYLKLCSLPDLRKAGELLMAVPAGDPAAIGDAFRAATDDLPADRATLLACARFEYEAALRQDPKHSDAARMKLLVKELPASTVGIPNASFVLLDEDSTFAKNVEKLTGEAKIRWAEPGYLSPGSLSVTSGKPKTVEFRSYSFSGITIAEVPIEKEYRYLRFAYKCPAGTQAIIEFDNTQYCVGTVKIESKQQRILATELNRDWVVVTRDLYADVNTKFSLGFMKLQTDGEIQIDAVYLGKSLRSLNRTYPKPPAK